MGAGGHSNNGTASGDTSTDAKRGHSAKNGPHDGGARTPNNGQNQFYLNKMREQ